MLKELAKFFPGKRKSPAITQEPDTAANPAGSAKMSESRQAPSPSENISFLKRCDQKLEKLSKFLSGEPETSVMTEQPPTETPTAEAQADSARVQATAPEPATPGDISLLEASDRKLEKLTKFFSGSGNGSAKTPRPHAAEMRADAVEASQTPQKSPVPDNISLLKLCDQKLAKWTNFFSGADVSPPLAATMPVSPDAESAGLPASSEPRAEREPPSVSQQPQASALPTESQTDALEMPETPPSSFTPDAPEPENRVGAAKTVAEPAQHWDVKIEEQLQMLEQLLELQIKKINNAESDLCAFKEELRQQVDASVEANAQQLLENKDALEIMLKSAFKKIADRQAALENSFNQQIDLLQEIIAKNQQSLTENGEKLNDLSQQTWQLTENLRQISKNIDAYKAQVDLASLTARLTALESPPKRKSWFGK